MLNFNFRQEGHKLVDRIAELLENMEQMPVTSGKSPGEIRELLGERALANEGGDAKEILERAAELLVKHSLLNGHPKFFGYITGSPLPLGMLADFLASAINPNLGANILSPVGTAIELQAIRWLTAFIGVPDCYGGIFVSGGNMANFTAFCAARNAKAPASYRDEGVAQQRMTVYCASSTHTWIEKAMVLFGHGKNVLRWIDTDADNRIRVDLLEAAIEKDKREGYMPFMVIGNAGDVSTGVVDDLYALALVCKKYDCWFHVDGAYGVPAAVLPELSKMFHGIGEADSIALDPHKWLYSPLEAGCTLLKDPTHLRRTYSSHPSYYRFEGEGDEEIVNFYEYGFQNSRGFRALKVWMLLQQFGRDGYAEMIRKNISLAKLMFDIANGDEHFEAVSNHLSITTFRFLPKNISNETEINDFNEKLLAHLQKQGEVFLSNAMVQSKFLLRACIVNFRTTEKDIRETMEIIRREAERHITI